MGETKITKSINKFLQNLSKRIKVENLLIFGSQSQNLADKDSDIDILIISSDFKKMDEEKRLDLLYKSSRFIEPEIHPWGITQEELDNASELTTIGYARKSGKYLLPQ